MSTNLRNHQLLRQIEKNPLRPAVAPAFDIADDFKRDMEELGQNRKWSPEGRRDEAQSRGDCQAAAAVALRRTCQSNSKHYG